MVSHNYAGFWIRLVAAVIDSIILSGALKLLNVLLGRVGLGSFILFILVYWLYFGLLESSERQASIGKMVFKLKVTDLKGKRINFGRATGRHFAKFISTIILGVGFLMIAFTEKKQGLHDMIAKTLVMKGK